MAAGMLLEIQHSMRMLQLLQLSTSQLTNPPRSLFFLSPILVQTDLKVFEDLELGFIQTPGSEVQGVCLGWSERRSSTDGSQLPALNTAFGS